MRPLITWHQLWAIEHQEPRQYWGRLQPPLNRTTRAQVSSTKRCKSRRRTARVHWPRIQRLIGREPKWLPWIWIPCWKLGRSLPLLMKRNKAEEAEKEGEHSRRHKHQVLLGLHNKPLPLLLLGPDLQQNSCKQPIRGENQILMVTK